MQFDSYILQDATATMENVFESPTLFLVGKKDFSLWLRESKLANEIKFGSSSG